MSLITDLTRMYLTHTTKPFVFTDDFDQILPYEEDMDFIFALPTQTFEDLKKDIDMAFDNGANHIAIYPLIDFTFTKNTVPVMPKKEKRKLLDEITKYCLIKGYERNSIP